MCQHYGWVIAPVFQRTDGLAGDTHGSCKIFLAYATLFSDIFNSVFQNLTPYRDRKICVL